MHSRQARQFLGQVRDQVLRGQVDGVDGVVVPQLVERFDRISSPFAWPGEEASITLEFDVSTGEGELGYKFLPIDQEVILDEKSQAAKDAE